jgi:hypothetical protein
MRSFPPTLFRGRQNRPAPNSARNGATMMRFKTVQQPDGRCSPLLPLPGERWVSRRKATVLAALREGETTFEEVCHLYSLSRDELASWVEAFERYGVPGLRATRVQLYRQLLLSGSGRG